MNGVDWGAFLRSMQPSDPEPLLSCDSSWCRGDALGDYYPMFQLMPLCSSMFSNSWRDGASTLFHEFLHHAGLGHTHAMKNVMKACYPDAWHGVTDDDLAVEDR